MTLPAIRSGKVAVHDTDPTSNDYEHWLSKVDHAQNELNELRETSEEFNKEISVHARDLIMGRNYTQSQLDIVEEEIAELEGIAEYQEGEELEGDLESDTNEVPRSIRVAIRKAFNEISKYCHPDKTRNTELVEIFYDACSAKERNDLGRLTSLLDVLRGSKSKVKSVREAYKKKISVLVADLKERYVTLRKEISDVKQTPIMQIKELHVDNPSYAIAVFRKSLEYSHSQMKLHLQARLEYLKTLKDVEEDVPKEVFEFEGYGEEEDFPYVTKENAHAAGKKKCKGAGEDTDQDEIKFRTDHPENKDSVEGSKLDSLKRMFNRTFRNGS